MMEKFTFWGGLQNLCHYKAWKNCFKYYSDFIPLKEERHLQLGWLEGE